MLGARQGRGLTEQENIVRYWHAVELLQPQSAPKRSARSSPYSAFIYDTYVGQPELPWSASSIVSRQQLPNRRVWSHTLFAHLYDSRCVAELLNEVYGAEQGYRESQARESALFTVKFTMDGRFVDGSFVLSSEAWFLGRVLTEKDWSSGFEDAQSAINDQVKALLDGQVSGDVLRQLTRWILQYIGVKGFFGDLDGMKLRFRSQPINPDKPEAENDPINSFLLNDLASVAERIGAGECSEPLALYLRQHDARQRLHIDDARASLPLIDRLMPDAYALSCWPTERHLGLVYSQQLAVNTILATLGDAQGVLGINGPPGTGKTTLLRDLIAAIVTSRADALSQLRRASDAFVSNGREAAHDNGKQQACFKLNPALYGFEIVVASSNNGAVENVTLELPQRDKIDESWLPEAEYFADLGELVSGKPAWALISGALGSKSRRTTFVDRYFYGKRPFGHEGTAAVEVDDEAKGDDELGDVVGTSSSTAPNIGERCGEDEARHNMPPNKEGPRGLLEWLSRCVEANRARTSQQRQALWQQAVADYEAAKSEARKRCADASRIRALIQSLGETRKQVAERAEVLRLLEEQLADASAQLSRQDAEDGRLANMSLGHCLHALEAHQARKPGFWVKVLSLWRAQRDWDVLRRRLEAQRELAKAEFDRIARLAKQLSALIERLEGQRAELRGELERLRRRCHAQTRDALDVARRCRADHLLAWLQDGAIGHGDAVELLEPWTIEGWRQARARVFIQALKLHQVFLALEASRMRSNLFLINSMLTGACYQGISRDAVRSAWASLFMVVPVLSSTFASFARSFGSLGVGELGWLLVDEAGQASPQAAVGALWRSRRALLVGDPLQLKPIVTVSDAVLEHMRTCYKVDTHWLPNRQSAQTLADEATRWGRMAGPAGDKVWVGLPLVVHRRCDKPMYELANRIAYDGAMVYGTSAPRPEKETPARLLTGWIQARGASQGNWVPAEGQALQALLERLYQDGVDAKDISVITPFSAVQAQLKRVLPATMVSGTIHTMQGKEAPVVIMVLGGNTEGHGARNWAVSEPNLLNVAATRAKRRFYVIGDRDDWKCRALFCDVMDLLPLQLASTRGSVNMTSLQ